MKIKIIFFVLILTISVSGIPVLQFPGWEEVERKSTDIIIVRCEKTIDDPANAIRGLINSHIRVIYVLKGQTNITSAQLDSMYWPRCGEQYALFSILQNKTYNAIETYRVIPLGTYFPTNSLAGKTLNQQIQSIFQWRLNKLNQELVQRNDEKERLESILSNLK
jgi:hypothetical protein